MKTHGRMIIDLIIILLLGVGVIVTKDTMTKGLKNTPTISPLATQSLEVSTAQKCNGVDDNSCTGGLKCLQDCDLKYYCLPEEYTQQCLLEKF